MSEGSNLKAKLRVQLLADSVVVAESDDPILWQRILSAIQGDEQVIRPAVKPNFQASSRVEYSESEQSIVIQKFASDLNISVDEVTGACSPEIEQPFLHLDDHYWEKFKKNIPARGPNSVAPIALSAALLNIWFKHSKIDGGPTIKQCQDVLNTIHVSDKNVARSIENTKWLQRRVNQIIINPSMRSKAVGVARAYCLRKGLEKSDN